MTAIVAPGHDEYLPAEMRAEERSDQQDCQEWVLSCNKEGMDFLRRGQYKQAFEQLKYAEAMLVANQKEDGPTSLLAVTCNNLGCYYKKVGKLHAALSYLRKALNIEVSLQTDDVTVAGTHLNICAILSKLDKHDKAVQHALCALDLINNRVTTASHTVTQDEYSVLAIAYHNVAVERDHLHQWEQAHIAYQQGHQVSKKYLGDQHPLTQTLARNCDIALQKSQKFSKERSLPPNTNAVRDGAKRPSSGKKTSGQVGVPALPEIPGRSKGESSNQAAQDGVMPIPAPSLHQEAADWMQNEDTAWSSSGGGGALAPSLPSQGRSQYQPMQPSPLAMQAQNHQPIAHAHSATQAKGLSMLSADQAASVGAPHQWEDFGGSQAHYKMYSQTAVSSEPGLMVGEDYSTYPTYVDATPHDAANVMPAAIPSSPPPLFVMNREMKHHMRDQSIKGDAKQSSSGHRGVKSTRAQRMADRMAKGGSSHAYSSHSDGGEEVKLQQSQLLRRRSAEKIQRTYRTHVKYMKDNRDRIKREHASATKIQARWRAYHVRRKRLDQAAICIQRWMCGHHVRQDIRRHNAAVTVQRHAMGLMARKHLREFNKAATSLQKIARGRQARERAKAHEVNVNKATLVIQCAMRCWKARQIVKQKRMQRDANKARIQAATEIQSVHRGNMGRRKAMCRKHTYLSELQEHHAATRLQATVRQKQATARVEVLRELRYQSYSKAATVIQKLWLGNIHRKRYLELQQEFRLHENSIVSIQRYVRGFLVRLRMWRDAIRAEEELWAAVEIQRVWRGYMGRLRWELTYEAVWSREVAAQRLQRFCRGWLARTRVHRMRRKAARSEFEKARRRFKAAQKIQANVRGWIARRRTQAWRERILKVVITIQRCLRGHQLRYKLWHQVLEKRAVQMQAVARGFLIRNRRFHFIANVICIQRHYRMWLRWVPPDERRKKLEHLQAQRGKRGAG